MPDEADRSVVQALRILHIEDSEADSLLVQQKLRHEGLDCQVDRVETREQFEQALGQNCSRVSTRSTRSEEHTSELQSHLNIVCRLLLEKKKKTITASTL